VRPLVDALVASGVTTVATLPDSWLAPTIDAVAARADLRLVRVAREDDAIGVAAGVWLAGGRAAVLCQNAGLLLAANALAGLAQHHHVPVPIVCAARGGAEDGFYYHVYKDRSTVPVLDALGVPWTRIDAPAGFARFADVVRQAELGRRPAVLLATGHAWRDDGGAR
jgi:sulfopyruvate decarboxylase subunit alpha